MLLNRCRTAGRLLAPLAAAGLAFGALTASSSAYVIHGEPWPGPTITYHTFAAKYVDSVDRAARIWNQADVGIKLRRRPADDAQVIVRYGGDSCTGWAIVGHASDSRMRLGKGCDADHIVLVAVHEFGHVLGLGHELDRCARMNPTIGHTTGTPSRCAKHPQSYWLNHALRADDIAGARALYLP
jgi:Astacin (Peptidase family M12A)